LKVIIKLKFKKCRFSILSYVGYKTIEKSTMARTSTVFLCRILKLLKMFKLGSRNAKELLLTRLYQLIL
jgi:hypothetical protein